MKLDYIKLHNYRQHVDNTIKFPDYTSKENFIIIIGTTGAGKTNILNAVTWCLYGIEYNIRDRDRGLPLINTIIADELSEGDSAEVSVEIQMVGFGNERIIFKRTLNFVKKGNDPIPIRDFNSNAEDGSTFTMLRQIGHDIMPIPDPEYILNRLIPQSIEEYFFFDGERLDDYFKKAARKDIKDSVLKISQIGVFENLVEHMDNRKRMFSKKYKNVSSQAKRIEGELKIWRGSRKREKDEYNKLKANLSEAERRFEEVSEELLNYPDINISEMEEERKKREGRIIRDTKRKEEIESDKLKFLIEKSVGLYAYEPIINLLSIIKESEEAGSIPPEYRKPFLQKLLDNKECICGENLKKNKKAREKIEKLLDEYDEIGELSRLLIRLEGNIYSIISDIDKFKDDRKKYNKQIRKLNEEIKRDNKELKKIEEKIKGIDKDEVTRLNIARDEWFNKIQEINVQIGKKEHELSDFDKKIKVLESDYQKELKKDERSTELANIREFCDEVLKVANNIKNDIMIEIKDELEEKTKNQFFSLIWKKDDYKDVKIDDNYNVSVVHISGQEGIGTLSAGEGIILALSFMAAINSVSGFDVPIIIDTPLSRIDQEPREKIAANLPDFLPEKQVTMLVTTVEYTKPIQKLISKRVGKTYKLNFKEMGMGGLTEVIEIE
ncbi:MAG: AAA family ATPase [Candidatus Odinarchaeia archaeon]